MVKDIENIYEKSNINMEKMKDFKRKNKTLNPLQKVIKLLKTAVWYKINS